MNVTISIPDELTEKLKQRAADVSQSVPEYASRLIANDLSRPTLDELLAPVREDFAKSGMSEEELLNLGREALQAVRSEKQAKSA